MKKAHIKLKPVYYIFLLWLLALTFVITGPVWVSDRPFQNTEYYRKTLSTLADSQFLSGRGSLYAGFAREEIVTAVGQPIMGFSDRSPLASSGNLDRLYASALTVKVGDAAVSIVGADVMLLMGSIIEDIYRETGLTRNELFFTATHTHSGVGGWFRHPVFELFYGAYSPVYYERLKYAIVSAIRVSRLNLQPAQLKYTSVDAGEWLEDRIYKNIKPEEYSGFHGVNPYLTGISFVEAQDPNQIIATLAVYAAHATVVRKDVHKFSRDYPGVLCNTLQQLTGSQGVLFAAGSVGDARSVYLHQEGAVRLGTQLAQRLAPEIVRTPAKEVTELKSLQLPIVMPLSRMSLLGAHSSVFPLIAAALFENPVYISYLQLGTLVLVGMPVDMAGELTKELQDERPFLITSFNGSWKGYATKSDTYLQRSTYSTREMGVSGAQAGEYLMDIAEKIYAKAN